MNEQSYFPEKKVVDILIDKGIDLVCTLPCDRIKSLIPMLAENFKSISLTREENGVGICAGAYMAGAKPLMVIQSTGLGNMINALESLNLTYNIPLPVIASWRGVYKEPISAQWALGRRLPAILEAAGIKYTIIDSAEQLDRIGDAVSDAFSNFWPHIILVLPKVWEGSTCENPPAPRGITSRRSDLVFKSKIGKPVITRYEALQCATSLLDGEAVVVNIGIPCKELYEIKDRNLNFYMTGSMGLASSIGLGISMFTSGRVVVFEGDGSILMNPNALTAIGEIDPPNLTIVALDNGAYGSTGNQDTQTCELIDLELLAVASGIKNTARAHTCDELEKEMASALDGSGHANFIHMVIKPQNKNCPDIPLGPVPIKERFMRAVGNNKK